MGDFTNNLINPTKINIKLARSALSSLTSLDLTKDFDEAEVQQWLGSFVGHQVRVYRLQPGTKLFRGQICDKPENIRRLGYPPPAVARINRANKPGRPMLYCCAAREAPFFELQPSAGHTVVLAHWTTTAPMTVNHAGYTHSTFAKLGSSRSGLPKYRQSKMDAEVAETFAELFTRKTPPESEQYLYKFTSTIAEYLLEGDLLDGLLYPAVAMRGNADNLALKPRYADQHLKFEKAEVVRVDTLGDFSYKVTVLDTAKALGDSGEILWRGRADGWELKNTLIITAEHDKWVARDMAGNIVEPD